LTEDQGGFRQVGERLVHQGHVVAFAVGTFEGPDGTTFERDIVRHPGAVSVVAVDDEGMAVLVRQYRAVLDEWILELPAGKLDVEGEDPVVCAQRELVEEVGLEATEWELLAEFHHSPGFCDELGRVYLARGLTAVPDARQGVEEETMTLERWPLEAAVRMVTDGTVHDAKTCIGLLLARDRLQA
jgi:8-oxo-dGTP pyrophosphatase MutT (NUDIX family)